MKGNHTTPVILFGLFLIASTAHAQNPTPDQVNRAREEERAQNLVARRVPSPNPNDPSDPFYLLKNISLPKSSRRVRM